MAGGRLMPMVLAGIRVGGIGWELNRRSQSFLGAIWKLALEAAGCGLQED
jgi:hypothetical protein